MSNVKQSMTAGRERSRPSRGLHHLVRRLIETVMNGEAPLKILLVFTYTCIHCAYHEKSEFTCPNHWQASMKNLSENLQELLHVPEYLVPSLWCNQDSNFDRMHFDAALKASDHAQGESSWTSQRSLTALKDGHQREHFNDGPFLKTSGGVCPNPLSQKLRKLSVELHFEPSK